jgi:hypothetical protein
MIIGAHVPSVSPLEEAEQVGAECVQMFVGPQIGRASCRERVSGIV